MFAAIFGAIGSSVFASILVLGLTIYGGYALTKIVIDKIRK